MSNNSPVHPHLTTSFVTVIPDEHLSNAERIISQHFGAGTLAAKGHAEFAVVTAVFQHIQYQKGLVYGNSYKKRGELLSTFPNLARKWDRLEKLMELVATGKPLPQDETLVDTVADLGVYCILWVADMANTRPEQFERFIQAAANLKNG